MTILAQDTFDGDTVGTIAPGWSNLTGAFTVLADPAGGSNRVFGCASPADGNVCFLSGVSASASLYFETLQRVPVANVSNTIGSFVRMASDGSTGYLVNVAVDSSGNVALVGFKKTGAGAYSSIGTGSSNLFPVVVGDVISLKVVASASTISAYAAKNGAAY